MGTEFLAACTVIWAAGVQPSALNRLLGAPKDKLGRARFFGFPAWLVWLVVHIYYLIGFKNRLFVLTQWVWAYVAYGRGARLIVHKAWKLKEDS
jgi:NADH dehydrogenase FAD-containing subunit